jgi:hypothetical protein
MYQPHPKDEKDIGGRQLVRARYLVPDKHNREESWLVYDNAGDTCGAITPTPNGRLFGAFAHGKLLATHKTVREAVACLLPTVGERNEFTGHQS